MKIGILTHHYVSNYGAFLQAYALADAVSKAYPDDTVEIIDYINLKHFIINFGGWFRLYPDRENLKCWLEKLRVPFTFAKARKENLRLSPRCYTIEQVNRLQYDVIIVGSDEVWNYQDKKSGAQIKFGHGLTCGAIIAYAPSVGNSQGDIPDMVSSGIRKFQAISVRDESTGALVQEITGEKPVRVVDPTCLCVCPSRQVRNIRKPYILFYYCDHLPETIKEKIFAYAASHGMAVYGAGECNSRYDAVTVNLHPFEWVYLFENAEYVFTGTFHGVLFSILNRRQFWVHLTNKSRIRKVGCLLEEYGIPGRELDETVSIDQAVPIDYSTVYAKLEKQREQSLTFLKAAIHTDKGSGEESIGG